MLGQYLGFWFRSNFHLNSSSLVESFVCSRCLLTSRVVTDTSCGCQHRVLLLASCVVIGIIGDCYWHHVVIYKIRVRTNFQEFGESLKCSLTNQHLVSVPKVRYKCIYSPVWQLPTYIIRKQELSLHNHNLFCFVYESLNITSPGTHRFNSPITIYAFAEPFSPGFCLVPKIRHVLNVCQDEGLFRSVRKDIISTSK